MVVAGCLKSQDGEDGDGGVEGRGAVYDSDRKSIFLAVVSNGKRVKNGFVDNLTNTKM